LSKNKKIKGGNVSIKKKGDKEKESHEKQKKNSKEKVKEK
jgi:hypothetical protein